MCPATSTAYLIAQGAVDQLIDALPEMHLDGELKWRSGAFQRALEGLIVTFDPYTMPARMPPPPILPAMHKATA